mmetsp:Transcript_6213/g.18360  ORF Transcript_6213/g.18360 Transcript_6213/m.18360 type:complete len:229 (+) Transcript_6213:1163-1849(+)
MSLLDGCEFAQRRVEVEQFQYVQVPERIRQELLGGRAVHARQRPDFDAAIKTALLLGPPLQVFAVERRSALQDQMQVRKFNRDHLHSLRRHSHNVMSFAEVAFSAQTLLWLEGNGPRPVTGVPDGSGVVVRTVIFRWQQRIRLCLLGRGCSSFPFHACAFPHNAKNGKSARRGNDNVVLAVRVNARGLQDFHSRCVRQAGQERHSTEKVEDEPSVGARCRTQRNERYR